MRKKDPQPRTLSERLYIAAESAMHNIFLAQVALDERPRRLDPEAMEKLRHLHLVTGDLLKQARQGNKSSK